jgi:hypothetical protein
MKNIHRLILKVTHKSRPVSRQMELPLPGSRLTRDEISFLRQIRQIREQIASGRNPA